MRSLENNFSVAIGYITQANLVVQESNNHDKTRIDKKLPNFDCGKRACFLDKYRY